MATLPSEKVPRRTWKTCGSGCLEAPTILPGLPPVNAVYTGVTGAERGGEIYYHVAVASLESDSGYGLHELARLSDDAPLAVVRTGPDCVNVTGMFSPTLFATLQRTRPGSLLSVGRASTTLGAPVVYAAPGFDIESGANQLFDLDHHWGSIRNSTTVDIALDPASTQMTAVYSTPSIAVYPATRDDVVAWADYTDWSPSHRAGAAVWTPTGGALRLIQGESGDVVKVAITEDRLVWMEATGLSAASGLYESGQLFYSPRTVDPSAVQRLIGPVIPHTELAIQDLIAYGDLAAMVVSDNSGVGVVVANIMTGQTWFIPARPGKYFFNVMAMDAKSLLLKEYDASGSSQYMDTLVRLDLAKLDDLVMGWQ